MSPSGSDLLDGSSVTVNTKTKTGPFKTLGKAQQAVRDLKATGGLTEPVTVHIAAGTFQLPSALEFTDADSGEVGKEIIWDGVKGGTLVTGAIQLKGCSAYDENQPEQVLNCPLPNSTVASITQETDSRIKGNAPKFEVFVDDVRMQLARWPDYGWAYVRTPLNTNTKFKAFQTLPDFQSETSNARVHIYAGNDYFDQYIGVSNIDLINNQIELSTPTNNEIGVGRRFYIDNVASALTIENEWFYDNANEQILFIPPYGSAAKKVYISNSKNLVTLTGTKNIKFSNLTFRHSTSSAIVLDNTNAIILDNLEINNVGGAGINGTNSTSVTVSNNVIHSTGRGGISLSGGDRVTLTQSGNKILNNYIYEYSDILFNIADAIIVNGVGALISHNTITNGNGGAIYIRGNDHFVERNDISRICITSGDCGSIYSAGDWTYRGNVLRYNYIHDSYGYTLNLDTLNVDKNIIQYKYDSARGIYLDNGVSGFNVFGNLVVNAGYIGIQIGGGRDNNIENNIVKTNKKAIYIDSRSPYYDWNINRDSLDSMPIDSPVWKTKYPKLSEPMSNETWPEGNQIVRNIFISTTYLGYSFKYQIPSVGNTIMDNIVWHATSQLRIDYKILDTGESKGGSLWPEWMKKNIEQGTINADPCLSIVGKKISLTCDSSPAISLGIQGLPSDFGIVK
ncbi:MULTISPECIES: right-handed parallel beta-helix repeat-containing protein [Methylomonas]|uniref:right-handed parallel beta-helix repeat-containing protein n=1 Tax=Methylomonas TaxID=416 RepID=UPI0018D33B2D|nr:right-handed parallel beta-helix repeat-containing protein [Methylomonas koyamae]